MNIKALTFDTYGTVVDWRGSILAELEAFGAAKQLTVDWEAFLADWKSCYRPGMEKVNNREWPWTTVDEIYRWRLVELLNAYHITDVTEPQSEQLNHVWRRLRPWPDSVPGLKRLRSKYIIAPLSNASFAAMVHLAKWSGLPWDCIMTAENAKCYKPRPEVYQAAIRLLGLRAGEVMMVAAHNYDLRAAQANGMRTAFIPRPTEYSPAQTTDLAPEGEWDLVAKGIEDLAQALGA